MWSLGWDPGTEKKDISGKTGDVWKKLEFSW